MNTRLNTSWGYPKFVLQNKEEGAIIVEASGITAYHRWPQNLLVFLDCKNCGKNGTQGFVDMFLCASLLEYTFQNLCAIESKTVIMLLFKDDYFLQNPFISVSLFNWDAI